MSQTQDSNALKWSVALACIPTTIVVLLIVLLCWYMESGGLSGSGEGAIVLPFLLFYVIIVYGGIAVLVCSLIGVIAAIVGWRRTHSDWAWIVLALNILAPLVIVSIAILALLD